MSTVRADNFGNRAGTSQISADTLLQGTAKAWLNMNGTGTIAVRDGFNVSSLVDNGVGSYAVNIAVAFASINYSVFACSYPTVTSYESMCGGTNLFTQFVLFLTSFTGAGVPSRQDGTSIYSSAFADPV